MEENKNYGIQPEPNEQSMEQKYGKPNEQSMEQRYGQPNGQEYGQQRYGQSNGQEYGQQKYGQQVSVQSLTNNFALKMIFSILEILCCCLGNVVTLAMGIVSCIFTVSANKAYKQGDVQSFQSRRKNATICLWIGLAFVVVELIFVAVNLAGIETIVSDELNSTVSNISDGIYVSVDGQDIVIPSAYAQVQESGFSLDSYDAGTKVDGQDFEFLQLVNEKGEYVMWCWLYNDSSEEKAAEECRIIGIDVDLDCDNYESYRTSEGLGFADTAEDFIRVYGEADKFSSDGAQDSYTWYFDGKSDAVWRVMEVTFTDGELSDIDIDYK